MKFFLELIRSKSEYSIKKFYSFLFMLLIIYMSVTQANTELVITIVAAFLAMLGIRSFDKVSFYKNNKQNGVSEQTNEESGQV